MHKSIGRRNGECADCIPQRCARRMPIENFDDLIGTWAPATLNRSGQGGEREAFHFSPLGHFVMEWGDERGSHLQVCEVALTEEGFEFTDRRNGTALELQASLRGRSLVLTSPHGQRTILRRVVEEMEARDWAFFVKGTG